MQLRAFFFTLLLSPLAAHGGTSAWAGACQHAWDEGNPTNLVSYCTKGAKEGDARSQYYLGNMYSEGIGVKQDQKKASELWMQAANAGVAEAQHNVGRMYQKGIGVEQSFAKALDWYAKAAAQGDAYAMHNIGFFYQKGQGVPVDFKKAAEWYGKAAEKGLPNSQYNLAVMLYNGEELPKDRVRAYAWLILAAPGFSSARNDLSVVEKNLTPDEIKKGRELAPSLVKK